MAMIYITCPDRTADISMPARAMIAILDLGEFFWGAARSRRRTQTAA